MVKTILVAVNNDGKKEAVLREAMTLAKRFGADLVIAHVNQIILPQTGSMNYTHSTPITVETISVKEMERLRSLAIGASIKHVETKIIEGLDVASVITGELARKYHPDIIVCGDNQHHTFIEKMLGSTASSIVKHAPCSVYIVK